MPQVLFGLFNMRGRCNRRGLVIVATILLCAQIAAGYAMWASGISFMGPESIVLKGLFFWLATAAVAKRLHDLGLSAWWIPGSFALLMVWSVCVSLSLLFGVGESALDQMSGTFMISIAATTVPVFIATIWLHFAKGDQGANRYGPVPGISGFSRSYAESAARTAEQMVQARESAEAKYA